MDDKKRKIAGMILIFLGIVIAVYAVYKNFFAKEEETYSVDVESIEEYEAELPEEDSEAEKALEMKNVTDEMLEVLHTDEQTLSEMIRKWLNKNMEYTGAVGVEFYDMEEENNTPEKCSVMMKTIVGENQREEASRVLILDYYEELDKYNIHP